MRHREFWQESVRQRAPQGPRRRRSRRAAKAAEPAAPSIATQAFRETLREFFERPLESLGSLASIPPGCRGVCSKPIHTQCQPETEGNGPELLTESIRRTTVPSHEVSASAAFLTLPKWAIHAHSPGPLFLALRLATLRPVLLHPFRNSLACRGRHSPSPPAAARGTRGTPACCLPAAATAAAEQVGECPPYGCCFLFELREKSLCPASGESL